MAASQGESHEQAEQELTLQADLLRREIAELEQRQFSSMDVSDMQERLVELSGRYEEAARDERTDTSKLREQLQTLREKIARREGEQYQSNSRKRWRKRLPESKTWACGISGKALHIRRFMPVWSVLPVTGA